MAHDEDNLVSTLIPPHHPDYWASRKLAFAAIRALESAIADVRCAPLYVCTGYDSDGEPGDIVENIAPFDAHERAKQAVEANPNALSILESQKRLQLLSGFRF